MQMETNKKARQADPLGRNRLAFLLLLKMAEREGFEPSIQGDAPYDGLANRCFRPLSHLSAPETKQVPAEHQNRWLSDRGLP